MRSISIYLFIVLSATSCTKWSEKKQSKEVIITVINECYATITVYNLDSSIYTKETFDCDYEKEVYRQFEKGEYRVKAETGFKTKELYFIKNDYSANLNIEF
jgi:hypothetical protein